MSDSFGEKKEMGKEELGYGMISSSDTGLHCTGWRIVNKHRPMGDDLVQASYSTTHDGLLGENDRFSASRCQSAWHCVCAGVFATRIAPRLFFPRESPNGYCLPVGVMPPTAHSRQRTPHDSRGRIPRQVFALPSRQMLRA